MQDTKSLKKLIKFLRSQGVTEYNEGGIHLKLGPEPTKQPRKSKSKPLDVSNEVNSDPSFPSRDALLFWSADPAVHSQLEDEDANRKEA